MLAGLFQSPERYEPCFVSQNWQAIRNQKNEFSQGACPIQQETALCKNGMCTGLTGEY
jgi:hypothetical protein